MEGETLPNGGEINEPDLRSGNATSTCAQPQLKGTFA